MTRDDLDTLIRDSLQSQAGRIRTAGNPLPAVEKRLALKRLRQRQLRAAVPAVAAVAVGIVAIVGQHDGALDQPPGTRQPKPSLSPESTMASGRPSVPRSSDRIRRALETSPQVIEEMIGRPQPQGAFLCGYDLLGREGEVHYLYLLCGDYSTGPGADIISGSSLAARATIHGDDLLAIEFPEQSSIEKDLRELFPPDLVATAMEGGDRVTITPGPAKLLAEASKIGS